MSERPLKLLVLGAHPDDAEFAAGGIVSLYRGMGHAVKMVSVTNGESGHHRMGGQELTARRRAEAAASANLIGAESAVWDFPDGQLLPTLELRWQIIREIRTYDPDLVLTHRTNDYHPDHRAVGQAVQDASYLVTVPHLVPEVPALRRDPVVAYLPDRFTRPNALSADVVLDIGGQIETIVDMLACHASQVFEWLPYNEHLDDQLPNDAQGRRAWLKNWFLDKVRPRADRYRDELVAAYGEEYGEQIELIEVFEISEYALQASEAELQRLFDVG